MNDWEFGGVRDKESESTRLKWTGSKGCGREGDGETGRRKAGCSTSRVWIPKVR